MSFFQSLGCTRIRGPNCLASIGCVSAWWVEANLLGECLRTGWQGGTGGDVLCWDMGGGGGGKFFLDFIRLVALGIVCLLGFWLQRQQEQSEDHKMILADLFVLTATQKNGRWRPVGIIGNRPCRGVGEIGMLCRLLAKSQNKGWIDVDTNDTFAACPKPFWLQYLEIMLSQRKLSRSACHTGAVLVLLAFCHCSMNFIAGAMGYKRQTALVRHATATATKHLHDPSARDEFYGQPLNVAKYLVDLHDANAPLVKHGQSGSLSGVLCVSLWKLKCRQV